MDFIRNLQIISSPGVGGREIVPPTLARQLESLGHPTWLGCRSGSLVERLGREWNLQRVPADFKGYFDLVSAFRLANFIRKAKIQIIHAHWSRDLSNLILASGLAGGIPVVLTKHVFSTETKKDIFHSWVYRHTAGVIAVSHLVAGNLEETTSLSRRKIRVLYNGLDLKTLWNPARILHAGLRSEWRIPAQAPILGYAGRLNEGKGPHWLLQAFQRLPGEFKNWHLVFVGRAVGDSEDAYARHLKNDAKDSERIHFIDYRTDMPEVMGTFDIAVCTSAFESLGMVLVEAMAMERPVIGSNTGGVPEIIVPGVNGELYSSGNLEDLVQKMVLLMKSPERRKEMGRAGRRIVEEKFNLSLTAQRTVEFYREILEEKRNRLKKRTPVF